MSGQGGGGAHRRPGGGPLGPRRSGHQKVTLYEAQPDLVESPAVVDPNPVPLWALLPDPPVAVAPLVRARIPVDIF